MPIKRGINDEYYTLYQNIEDLYKTDYMKPSVFKDKIIYCNCDDYRWSNYVKFWRNNFDYFGIKKLIATNYDIGDGAYIYTFDGINEDVSIGRDDGSYDKYDDFINNDVIVTTNPPFSKSRDYYNFLEKQQAKFYVHSSILNTIKFWPNLNDIMYVYHGPKCFYYIDGEVKHVAATGIMTNIVYDRTASKVTITKSFDEVKHDFYYEGNRYIGGKWQEKILNVDWCNKIPYDYDDYMGVPISFIGVQPEIRKKYHIYDIIFYGRKFYRLKIKKI